MSLPVPLPIAPMLARAVKGFEALPDRPMLFEPKWDGFRCIVARDGDELELWSRNQLPLARYFPELAEPLRDASAPRCVLDGELVIATASGLDFDALQQRIHPAESRIDRLAAETPASYVAFDILALDDRALIDLPLHERRALLVDTLSGAHPPVHCTPATTDVAVARDWFVRFEGAGLDGVVAKPLDDPYRPDKRAQLKLKHERTADCVVAGYRVHKDGRGVGSLLLGLYDDRGVLHHVGVAASFTAARRRELVAELAPLEVDAVDGHPWQGWIDAGATARAAGQRLPGGFSRWNATKDLSFVPLRPELVAEVAYENVLNGRFRHGGRFRRWRPDRTPASCTYAQLEQVPPTELHEIFGV